MSKELSPGHEQSVSEAKILSYQDAITKIRESKERSLRVILALGVLDIVHIGHIEYLRAAKDAGDLLFVGIENDETVRLNKGKNRPFNSLQDRLDFLTELQSVDFVFAFENTANYGRDVDMYTRRYRELNPSAIAVSNWDPNVNLKKLQADDAGVELLLMDLERRNSSTRLLKMIGYE